MIKIEGIQMELPKLIEFFELINQVPVEWNFHMEDHNILDKVHTICEHLDIKK